MLGIHKILLTILGAAALLVWFGHEQAVARDARDFPGLQWRSYENKQIGVRLRYPSRLFKLEHVSSEGDGQAFVSRDGQARLIVGVIENSERLSLRDYQRVIRRNSYADAAIDYSPVGRTWFVLSGTIKDNVFYEKVIFGCAGARIGGFALIYPIEKKRLYDAIVEHIENSYRFSVEPQGCL